jgi:hypothetical protein
VLASHNTQSVDLILRGHDDDSASGAAVADATAADTMQAIADAQAAFQETLSAMVDRVAPLSAKPPTANNPCAGTKPASGYENKDCFEEGVEEQAAANVTKGYIGDFETDAVPITTPYFQAGLCPVNVHWHLGAEHYSAGQFDEEGSGPSALPHHTRKAR